MDPHEIFDKVIEVVEEASNQGLVGYQISGRVEKLRRDLLGEAEAVIEGAETAAGEAEVVLSELDAFLKRLDAASSHADVNALGAEVGLTLEEKAPKVDEKKALVKAEAETKLSAETPETPAEA